MRQGGIRSDYHKYDDNRDDDLEFYDNHDDDLELDDNHDDADDGHGEARIKTSERLQRSKRYG